jgi:oligo-1,6-glucosidase
VSHGSFRRVEAGDAAVFAFERVLDDEGMLVVANLSSEPREVRFAPEVMGEWTGAPLVLSNLDAADMAAPLRPWEARVFAR